MSIDTLPAEMPLEASEYFSQSLFSHVTQLVQSKFDNPVIKNATITHPDGTIDKRYVHLNEIMQKYAPLKKFKQKKVLLLGSGYVAGPLIDYLLKDKNTSITIASNAIKEATLLANQRLNIFVSDLNVSDPQSLGKLVKDHDVVIRYNLLMIYKNKFQ